MLAWPQLEQNFDWDCRFDPHLAHDTVVGPVGTMILALPDVTRPPASLELNNRPAIKTSTAARKT